ncbi:MAG: 16S rRNA (uracil(1498)-N(3))-methyltransferase [Clostridiales Family XIII bacterium]|jgi:16S rRNA (uracil1498-N3)-methyltransferase|nr:16S rRNA (uracil(1498)-N(3))-methyltransferase [Clostridiales Family XIII bacterium]
MMDRFFVDPGKIKDGQIRIDDPDDIRHLTRSLRAAPGHPVQISDGSGSGVRYESEIVGADSDALYLKITGVVEVLDEPKVKITLYQGIPKAEKMGTIIQKSVELGVSGIVPIFSSRTVVTDTGRMPNKMRRWRRISAEAAKQCDRGTIPFVFPAMQLYEAVDMITAADLAIFAYEEEKEYTIKRFLREDAPKNPGKVSIIIGPEGGFAPEEAEMLKGAGLRPVSLGKLVLRTETAGPAAIAMAIYELEL